MSEWILIGLFFALGWMLPAAPVIINLILSPKRANKVKVEAYECGVEMVGPAWAQFKPQWYPYALAFVVFDVEFIFMFPWAVAYNRLGLFALFEMAVFIALLLVALGYTARKRSLEWA